MTKVLNSFRHTGKRGDTLDLRNKADLTLESMVPGLKNKGSGTTEPYLKVLIIQMVIAKHILLYVTMTLKQPMNYNCTSAGMETMGAV